MSTLFVIEAPGKKATLSSLLHRSGPWPHVTFPIVVLATKGHICCTGAEHSPLDSSGQMQALSIDPRRKTEIAAIRRAAKEASNIIIATDDDDEGNVIARDVAQHCLAPGQGFLRCRLRAFDRSALHTALLHAQNMTLTTANQSALAGDTRRLVDYGIGYGLSTFQEKHRIPVGRVLSSTLIRIAGQAIPLGQQAFIAPALDEGPPFIATIAVAQKIDHRPIPALPVKTSHTGGVHAWNYADTIASVATKAKKPIADVSQALQGAYEKGLVTYPRSLSRTISASGLEVCRALAEQHGASFAHKKAIQDSKGAHEAVRPTAMASLQKTALHDLEALTVIEVARQAIRSGQDYVIDIPDHTQVPEEILQAGARFSRLTLHGFLGWKERKSPPPEWQEWSQDVALLHFMADNELGRPGTWVKHIQRLTQRGILTPNLHINRLGKMYVQSALDKGISAQTSQTIEAIIQSLPPEIDAGSAAFMALRQALPGHADLAWQALTTPAHALQLDNETSPPQLAP